MKMHQNAIYYKSFVANFHLLLNFVTYFVLIASRLIATTIQIAVNLWSDITILLNDCTILYAFEKRVLVYIASFWSRINELF